MSKIDRTSPTYHYFLYVTFLLSRILYGMLVGIACAVPIGLIVGLTAGESITLSLIVQLFIAATLGVTRVGGVALLIVFILMLLYTFYTFYLIRPNNLPHLCALIQITILMANLHYAKVTKNSAVKDMKKWIKDVNKTMKECGYQGDYIIWDSKNKRFIYSSSGQPIDK